MNEVLKFRSTDDVYGDICNIIEESQVVAIKSINVVIVLRNWLLGKRIATESMDGTRSERYGEGIISKLSDELTQKYGKGFDKRSLYRYVQFFREYPKIVGTVTTQSGTADDYQIVGTVTPQSDKGTNIRVILSWSHYERLSFIYERM